MNLYKQEQTDICVKDYLKKCKVEPKNYIRAKEKYNWKQYN